MTQAVIMIFKFEYSWEQGASGSQQPTIRGRGNAAAHLLDADNASDAVLEVGLRDPDRSLLESIYTLVFQSPLLCNND